MNNKKKIGALWTRKSNNGDKTFLSGNIEIDGRKISLLVFKNSFVDENPKAPNFIIYEVPDDNAPAPKEKASKPKQEVSAPESDEDVF